LTPAPFRPPWWCRGAHVQTLWAPLLRRPEPGPIRRQRLELEDGDFLDLAWSASRPAGAPRGLALLLHGLEGSLRSPYAAGLLRTLQGRGWRACLMHFRGCSGEPNRLRRGYHSGETGDLAAVTRYLAQKEPSLPLVLVGFSLGGNVLLKWLGELGATRTPPPHHDLRAAVAVSVPYSLGAVASRLDTGLSRLYRRYLVRRLQRSYRRKFIRRNDAPAALEQLPTLSTFRRFDDRVTAPLHGFAGVDDYYRRCSSRRYLRHIRVPTLLLHAADDPFMSPDVIPREGELATAVRLEVSAHGGHVGFVYGRAPWRPRYWLEERIPAFLEQQVALPPASRPARRRPGRRAHRRAWQRPTCA
jgi:predicted alpha/beta-fold hydrolase